jgi:hypothetical protein
MTVKYGIKVPFDSTTLRVMTYKEGVLLVFTREDAEAAAQIWKTYTIEEHFDNENFDWDSLANNQKA